jgi:hypothetical protein
MWSSRSLYLSCFSLVCFLTFIESSKASPHIPQRHDGASDTSLRPYYSPVTARYLRSSRRNSDLTLSSRAQNATCKGHIAYQDFTFLIRSHAHAALLSKNVRRDLPVRFRRLRLHRAVSTDSIYLGDVHTDHPFRPVACSGGSPAAAG